jgi:hypothetical protein
MWTAVLQQEKGLPSGQLKTKRQSVTGELEFNVPE